MIPAGLAALGVPWLVIFAVALVATAALAAGAYPAHRGLLLIAVVASGIFALWAVKREQGYAITWMLCRNQRYQLVDGDFRLVAYWIGVHPINDNPFDLWMVSDEQTFSLAGKSYGGKLSEGPVRIPSHDDHFLSFTKVTFPAPVKLTDAGQGRIRYVMRYGRTPDKLDKTLIVSGKLQIEYPPDGETVPALRPDPDSSIPSTGDICVVPAA